ncbi:FAD-dependent oxidoreductase [Psychromicrobium lacuslunae]|uniref:FAD-dependent oxidoreductase n=1 Tax=Psychromicrobium lacuslunae TaxID=1618207 RepID=UPI000698F86F|nr:FAD-dependent oxidoreductase [Psychromicrobium lacuslunae]
MTETPTEHEIVIIGAGHSGLSLAWELKQRGLRATILERHSAMYAWHQLRWDNFTLVTPNWMCQLPGYHYQGQDPDGFMTKDEVCEWLQGYVGLVDADLREGVDVESVQQDEDGLLLRTNQGDIRARSVVVSTGGAFQLPRIPDYAAQLPTEIKQFHSLDYRNAAQLPPGAVLVVGSAQSGAQIAEDLMLEGREVHLAVGSAVRVSRFYRGRDVLDWLDQIWRAGLLSEALGRGQITTSPYVTGRDGGRDINLYDFAERGMKLYGRIEQLLGGRARFSSGLNNSLEAAEAFNNGFKDLVDVFVQQQGIEAPEEGRGRARQALVEPPELDLLGSGISSVIWATGLRADYRWLGPEVVDRDGQIQHHNGATAVPGLYYYRAAGLLGANTNWFDPLPIDLRGLVEQLLTESNVR